MWREKKNTLHPSVVWVHPAEGSCCCYCQFHKRKMILSSGSTAGCSEVKMTTARARCGNDETGKQQGILRANREDEFPPAAHFVSPFWCFPWWESLTLPVSCLRFSSYSSPLIRCLNITHTSNVQHASTQQNPAGLTGGRFNA